MLKSTIRRLIKMAGYTIQRIPVEETDVPPSRNGIYDEDGVWTLHRHLFLDDPDYQQAYERGCQAAGDLKWHWRVHIGLWAAWTANQLEGDFVECGVNRGFLSSAIMQYLDWKTTGRTFYLLDTFQGMDMRYVSEGDLQFGAADKNEQALNNGFYVQGVESVRQNFAEWPNVRIIVGSVPETLAQIDATKVAFLHLDMNCSPPEIAALDYLWDRLVPGAVVLMDDYGFRGYDAQNVALDEFARSKQVMIATIPTGQGVLIKPPRT